MIAGFAATVTTSSAQTNADFFKGKQVNIMVAYSTGGDLYARPAVQRSILGQAWAKNLTAAARELRGKI